MNYQLHDEENHLFTLRTLIITLITIAVVALVLIGANAVFGWILDVKEMIDSSPSNV